MASEESIGPILGGGTGSGSGGPAVYGELYQASNAVATSTPTQNAFVKVANWTVGDSAGTTPSASTSDITILSAVEVTLLCTLSFQQVSGNHVWSAQFFKNGSPLATGIISGITINATTPFQSITLTDIALLAINDVIDIRIACTDAPSTSVTVVNANLSMVACAGSSGGGGGGGTISLIQNTDGTITVASGTGPTVTVSRAAITGDVAIAGGSNSATLATVATAGTTGSASSVAQITIDAKGRTTTATAVPIQIAESAVTNLTSDLALKAPLASPTFTGVPAAPTAAPGTNTTQLATTAFVQAALPTSLPPSGAAGGALAGTYPNPTLASVITAGGPTGSATAVPTITYNAAGQLTAVTTTSIQIAESQVTNLVTDLAGKQVGPLTGDITTPAANNAATTLVGTANVESIIRANSLDQMTSPAASVNWNNQGITQLASFSMTDGTVGDGQITAQLNPPIIQSYASSGDAQPTIKLGTVSSNPTLAFGPGVSTVTDTSISRTGTALLQVVANTTTFPGASSTANLSLSPQTGTITSAPASPLVNCWSGTYTANVSSFAFGTAVGFGPTVTFSQSGFAFGVGLLFNVNPTLKTGTTVGTGFTFGPLTGLSYVPTFTVDTQTGITGLGNSLAVSVNPVWNQANAGTGTVASHIAVQSQANIGTGITMTAFTDFKVIDSAGSGTVTTRVGLDIPALSKATTNIGIRNLSALRQQGAFIGTPSTVTVTSNAGTVPVTNYISNLTNSSAAAMTITLATTGALDGQIAIVRVFNFSAVNENITWVNTETGVTPAATTNGTSTTIPRIVTFMFNNATTKWTCIQSV